MPRDYHAPPAELVPRGGIHNHFPWGNQSNHIYNLRSTGNLSVLPQDTGKVGVSAEPQKTTGTSGNSMPKKGTPKNGKANKPDVNMADEDIKQTQRVDTDATSKDNQVHMVEVDVLVADVAPSASDKTPLPLATGKGKTTTLPAQALSPVPRDTKQGLKQKQVNSVPQGESQGKHSQLPHKNLEGKHGEQNSDGTQTVPASALAATGKGVPQKSPSATHQASGVENASPL